MSKAPFILAFLWTVKLVTADVTIDVHTDQVLPSTPMRSGVCLEDVNHEVYGGLYSQMIFGESFQEPPTIPAVRGFKMFGGRWVVADQAVEVDRGDGHKLVSDHPAFADGTVEVELRFPDRGGDNAGLLVRVARPGNGADAFHGYEVSVDPGRQIVRLARHRNNYELLKEAPCEVPVGQWVSLRVKLAGSGLDISVGGKSVLQYDDGTAAIGAGTVALRTWRSKVAFRNLSITTGGKTEPLPFEQAKLVGDVSGMWGPIVGGAAVARFDLDADRPFVGTQSQRVGFESGRGEVGVENRGLNRWGMNFVAGRLYEGCVWARGDGPTAVVAALESADGTKVYAEQSIIVTGTDWQRLDLRLTPTVADPRGRLTLKLRQPGSVRFGYAFLQPGEWGRFKGLPVRADIAEALLRQGVTVIRYGGSMVNSPHYRWKDMIGPRDHRRPYAGTWYPHSSNGWGVIDFLDFCQAAGVQGIPDLNVNESPRDLADFVEYVNGPADSQWGRNRAADGHPEPYRLTHLELGNEEKVDAVYAGKFAALADAIWDKDPDLILVVGDFAYHQKITDPDHVARADGGIRNMDGHKQILDVARRRHGTVWFDVHVWSEQLRPSDNLIALPSYIDAIDHMAGDVPHRVVVFELNADSHGQNRALANAMSINTIRRDGRVPVVISANALQPDGQNDNGWDQGLLFFDPSKVWLEPPGYVTQMQATADLPRVVRCDIAGTESARLDVTATTDDQGKMTTVQLVNLGDSAVSTTIHLAGLKTGPTIHATTMTDAHNGTNTTDHPETVRPIELKWSAPTADGTSAGTVPPRSLTVIRFE